MWPRRGEGRLLVGLTLLLSLPSAAAAQGAYLEGGLSFSTGDYVYTERTSGGAASAGLAWSTGRLTMRVAVPFFVRDTRLLTARGDPASPETTALASESGGHEGSVGDPFVGVHLGLGGTSRTSVGLGLLAKVPVLEAGDFATGGWDVGGSVSLSRAVGSSTLVGVDGAYWHLSDPPDLELRDTVMGTLTLARSLGPRWSVSASLSGSRSAVVGHPDAWWSSLLLGRLVSGGMWGFVVSVGLSDSAPDLGIGVIWRLHLS